MNGINDWPGRLILPAGLKHGETIGLVAPAGPLRPQDDLEAGIALLAEHGFAVEVSPAVYRQDGYLAGADHLRAREFNAMWANPAVKALLAVRGGYGCLRMVDGLDFELIRQQPKIFTGFSDISVLLTAILKKTGLVTFHGPTLTTLLQSDAASQQAFFDNLAGRPPAVIAPDHLEILAPGRARGRLLGGNLTNLLHLLATPYELAWQGAILFIEDVGEAPYRLDRLLTHLHKAGRLTGLAGLILGSFSGCGDLAPIKKLILELCGDSQPIWAEFPGGHGPANRILPLGVEAEMDSATGTLNLARPGSTAGS